MNIRKGLAVAGAALAVATSILSFSSPASAAGRDGNCDSGEFCLYYNSDNEGSISDFTGSVDDYGAEQPECYDFKGDGAGKGKCVKNEAASVWNKSDKTVRIYFNSGFGGSYQDFAAGAKGNLNATLKNNNASHEFSPSARTNMSYALYKTSGGSVTCAFDGYESTPGRHEGIDIARSVGSNVHALVSGTVTYVAFGSTGGSGLSTIAVYNASANKTVIYLHTSPKSGLSAGDAISKGELLGVESWRGVSSSSAAHTHIEVRAGRQTHAARSVNDPTLENADPTAFWNSQGYNEK
ncbi:peptidase inhibitor family I36 protein [Actinoplanes sp. NPDC049118]|uniref:peptidase inhibitor family I36 protein n=1 Tax=Actinoplanes sp. NPDC049118 TaxID=3155769 RepID=UPI0033FF15F4